MNNKIRVLIIAVYSVSLTACMLDSDQNISGYDHYSKQPSSMLYPEGYENPINDTTIYDTTPMPSNISEPIQSSRVVVPETYHMSSVHAPALAHDVDRSWVNQQMPNHYTIELAQNEKASAVAGVLAKAPKSARTAEIQTQKHGQTYYTGVYGSYASKEDAEAALNALPNTIKGNARVESWSTVQR